MDDKAQTSGARPFQQGGGVADLLRALDWSRSIVGEPTHWPSALRQALDLVLDAAHPMALFWGPRFVCFYNDAFRQCLGPEKHPSALGQPLRTAFAESQAILEPLFAGVLAGEGAVWRENEAIPIHRHGLLSDAFWTFSANPVRSDGGIGGVLFACQETTGAVRTARLLTAEDTALRTALDAGRIGHWTLDLTSGELDASMSCKINYGRSPHASFTFAELKAAIHPEDRARAVSALERAIERSEDYDLEYRVPRPGGRETWLLVRGRVAYDASGQPARVSGITMDVTRRRRAEEHLRLMVDELNHRVKNTLATVQSISRQTLRRADVATPARDGLDSRLLALSRAHDVLTNEQWSGADLAPIVRQACAPFGGPARFDISGPAVRLSPRIAIALALAFHELATNATKYGALSTAEGDVVIEWGFIEKDDQALLEISWREQGGPPVSPPRRRGFGSRLIQRSLAAELGGEVRIDYAPSGVVCVLRVQLSSSVLRARGSRFIVGRDGDSWTVADGHDVLDWFETQADAIAFLTGQLNALRVKGRSGTVVFQTDGPSDPPARRRRNPALRIIGPGQDAGPARRTPGAE